MRGMKGFVSDDFLTNGLPAMISETGGTDAGTILQSLYRGFGAGKAPKEALAAQQKYGLREGFSPFVAGNKKRANSSPTCAKGSCINADEFYKNPMLWFFERAMPAMQKSGVDTSDDMNMAEVFGDITGTGRQQDAW